MMFWDNIVSLCAEKNISVNAMCADIGLSNAIATKWKRGSIPHGTTLKKIADYFGVSTDFLLGKEKNKTPDNNAEGIIYPSYDEPSILMLHDEPNLPFKTEPEDIVLTAKEIRLIKAYRSKPEMRNSVDILLGINEQPDLTEDMAETVNKTALSPINKN